MTVPNVILLHGFASSSGSRKSTFLRGQFDAYPIAKFYALDFNPTVRDFEYMTVTGMINRLRQAVLDRQLRDLILIGSSMGALVGLHYAKLFAGVEHLLLLAPALTFEPLDNVDDLRRWRSTGIMQVNHYAFGREVPLRFDFHLDGLSYREYVKPPAPLTIIHGKSDNVVPIDNSRDYAARFKSRVNLIEVQSDHTLADQLQLIWGESRRIIVKKRDEQSNI